MMSPTISIVIVNWNGKVFLADCLQSLRDCGYPGVLETVVVDNASTDGSQEMVRERFPEVMLVCNDQNLGFAKANNIGIRQCRGPYVALVNSDVCVLPDCFDQLVAYLEVHPLAGMVGPFILGADGKQQRSCRGFPALWSMFCRALALDTLLPEAGILSGYLLRHWDHRTCAEVDILSGCFWVARREALRQVGGLDEAFFIYGEDMDWCKRFWRAHWPLVFVPQARAVHYGGASSANEPVRFFVEKQRADCQYWAKHHSHLAVRAYLAICMLHHSLRVVGHALVLPLAPRNASGRWHKVRRSAACLRWIAIDRLYERKLASG